jgi:hypothetical protein
MQVPSWIKHDPKNTRNTLPNVLAEAKRTGTLAYYVDDDYPEDMICEYPDGHRERIIKWKDGNGTTVKPIPPRREC